MKFLWEPVWYLCCQLVAVSCVSVVSQTLPSHGVPWQPKCAATHVMSLTGGGLPIHIQHSLTIKVFSSKAIWRVSVYMSYESSNEEKFLQGMIEQVLSALTPSLHDQPKHSWPRLASSMTLATRTLYFYDEEEESYFCKSFRHIFLDRMSGQTSLVDFFLQIFKTLSLFKSITTFVIQEHYQNSLPVKQLLEGWIVGCFSLVLFVDGPFRKWKTWSFTSQFTIRAFHIIVRFVINHLNSW